MKKLKLVFAVLFMLITPIFALRQFLLKNAWKGMNQLAHAENWAVINGYAAAISLTIGFLFIICSMKSEDVITT